MSSLLLAGSFLSFAFVAWYADMIAADRKKMMRLRIISNFFQVAELTTLIQLSWPDIVYMTLPFQLPISDVKCLASSSGFTQEHTMYGYIYGPILVFLLIFRHILRLRAEVRRPNHKPLTPADSNSLSSQSIERVNVSGTLIVLTTLWYSPLLQTIASMYDCFEDIENNDELVLVSDPSVSCETSFSRNLVHMHALFAAVFVGAGFPLFSFFKIRQLKKLGKLDASSSFSSLYQFYNTDAPYFESFLFLRKATLILSGELRTRYLIAWLCSSIPNSDTENTPTLYALHSFIIQRSYRRILP
jgi:hypothetical protein